MSLFHHLLIFTNLCIQLYFSFLVFIFYFAFNFFHFTFYFFNFFRSSASLNSLGNTRKEKGKGKGKDQNSLSGCENGNSNDNIVINNSKSSSSIIKHLEIINSITLSPPHLFPSRTSSEGNTHSCFDKVDIPPQFIGKVFGSLFRSLYETDRKSVV